MPIDKETLLMGPSYMKALLDAGISPADIEKGAQLFMTGEFVPLRKRAEEDPELVRQIEEQDTHSISGNMLEIMKKAGPGTATCHLAISRFIFLASGGTGPQKWCG